MTYLENLKLEAAKTVEGLGATVEKLKTQVARIEDRIVAERDNLARRVENIADFKAKSAEKLTASTSAYGEWQGRLRRLTQEWNSAKEALALLETVVAPKAKADLAVARETLLQGLTGLYFAGRPRCQARMAELLDAVVAEHDAYFFACKQLHRDHGFAFVTPAFDPGIVAEHARVSRCGKRSLTSLMSFVAFTDPPAEAPPPHLRPPEAAPVVESDRQVAPETTPPTALDTGAVPEQAPNAVPSVQNPAEAVQTAPRATNGERLDAQDAQDAPDPEKSGTTPATSEAPEPAGGVADADPMPPDLDAQDCAAVDAEDQADLDADAPPDAGKENPGIAADCA